MTYCKIYIVIISLAIILGGTALVSKQYVDHLKDLKKNSQGGTTKGKPKNELDSATDLKVSDTQGERNIHKISDINSEISLEKILDDIAVDLENTY